jgi:hypothetical protein
LIFGLWRHPERSRTSAGARDLPAQRCRFMTDSAPPSPI